MANTNIRTCDGCEKPVSDNEVGRKIVTGCLGPYPPSTVFDYCPTCAVPDLRSLAQAKPWHLIQEIRVFTETGWMTTWSGGIQFCPDRNVFTDGYEAVLPNATGPV